MGLNPPPPVHMRPPEPDPLPPIRVDVINGWPLVLNNFLNKIIHEMYTVLQNIGDIIVKSSDSIVDPTMQLQRSSYEYAVGANHSALGQNSLEQSDCKSAFQIRSLCLVFKAEFIEFSFVLLG